MRTKQQRNVNRVLTLFRAAVPADELDEDDWKSLQVAIRLAYDTEDLRILLHGKRRAGHDDAILRWSYNVEACIEFLSWTKCLASIVHDRTYGKERRSCGVRKLWTLHSQLSKQLLERGMSANRRISLLAELGGIELSLLGHFWWLKPNDEAAASRQARRMAKSSRAARTIV